MLLIYMQILNSFFFKEFLELENIINMQFPQTVQLNI